MRPVFLVLILSLAACGARGDLESPNGVAPPKPVWAEGVPKDLPPPPRQIDDVNLILTPDYVPKPAQPGEAQADSPAPKQP